MPQRGRDRSPKGAEGEEYISLYSVRNYLRSQYFCTKNADFRSPWKICIFACLGSDLIWSPGISSRLTYSWGGCTCQGWAPPCPCMPLPTNLQTPVWRPPGPRLSWRTTRAPSVRWSHTVPPLQSLLALQVNRTGQSHVTLIISSNFILKQLPAWRTNLPSASLVCTIIINFFDLVKCKPRKASYPFCGNRQMDRRKRKPSEAAHDFQPSLGDLRPQTAFQLKINME